MKAVIIRMAGISILMAGIFMILGLFACDNEWAACAFEKEMGTTKVVVDETIIAAGHISEYSIGLEGNDIVWVGHNDDNKHIYQYNFLSGQISQVTNDDVWACSAEIYGRNVYYADCDKGHVRKINLETGNTDPLTWFKGCWNISVNKKYAVYCYPLFNNLTVHPLNGGKDIVIDCQGYVTRCFISDNDYVFWSIHNSYLDKHTCFAYNLNAPAGTDPYIRITEGWSDDYLALAVHGDIFVYGLNKKVYAYNVKTRKVIATIPASPSYYITDACIYGDKIILKEYNGIMYPGPQVDYVLYDLVKKESCLLFEGVYSYYVCFDRNRIAFSLINSGNIHASFLTFTPEITEISPLNAMRGSEITIAGRNFGYEKPSDTHVLFGNSLIENNSDIVSWSDNIIKVKVPSDAPIGPLPIKIVNAAGYSNEWTITVNEPQKPDAPTNLSLVSVTKNSATLSWTDNSVNEDVFEIERREGTPTGPLCTITMPSKNISGKGRVMYTNTWLKPGQHYYYKVCAKNKKDQVSSDYTPVLAVYNPSGKPDGVKNLQAVRDRGNVVRLSWTNISGSPKYICVEKLSGQNSFEEISRFYSSSARVATDYNAISSKAYYYRVRTYDGVGYSSYSNTAFVAARQSSKK